MFDQTDHDPGDERWLSGRRVRTLLLGALGALVLGFLLVNLYTYVQYGGTMFDRFSEKKETKSPMAGKLAFDKGTKYYIGVIRGEGHSPRRGAVYYIEQAGGSLIEVSKDNIEVRDPEKTDK